MTVISKLLPEAKAQYYASQIERMKSEGKVTEQENKYLDTLKDTVKSDVKKRHPFCVPGSFLPGEDDLGFSAFMLGLPVLSPFVGLGYGIKAIIDIKDTVRNRKGDYAESYANELALFIEDKKSSGMNGSSNLNLPPTHSNTLQKIAFYESKIEKMKEKGGFSKDNESELSSLKKDSELRSKEKTKFALTIDEKMYLCIPWYTPMTAIAVGVRALFHKLHKKEEYQKEYNNIYVERLAEFVPTLKSSGI